jgi:endonuclease/exonuclease/phosphatase family metal-dependent hydrolase
MRIFSCALVLLIFLFSEAFTQESEKSSLRFVFYNTENFFDTYDDSLKEDNDFLPHGLMRWNYKRYSDKINSLYKVITAAGEWDSPSLAGFCEVEKKSVLQDLIAHTYLSKFNYGIIHEESSDPRGIDVCLIYRKNLLRLLSHRYLKPDGLKEGEFRTRSVLYSKWAIYDDTIHLFLNHWPSRRGGVLAGESLRKKIAGMVKEKADSISKTEKGNAKIIIAGDFNCTPGDEELSVFTGNGGNGKYGIENLMINLSESSAGKGIGTYRYMGAWEMIDQVIVSGWLMKCTEGLYTDEESFIVFKPDFLLRRDPSYPGFIPYSTYRGYKYQGGFSDHLPVILDLKHR